jgi:selenocysteine lyase/cysteine desulfurase
MTAYLHERSQGRLETYQTDLPMVMECRSFLQKLINAESPHRIALTANTSDALNIVASGIPWKSGDRVLLSNIEFPANVWPYLNCRRLGVELDLIPSKDGRVTPEMIEDGLTPHTRLVALSAVQFLSGYRADLETIGEICRDRGIVFAVDGIQAVGAVGLNVRKMKIDALAAGGQKWQMSPHGTGFLYLTEELQSRIQQSYLGWLAVADPWDFHNFSQAPAASARRYEGGSLIMPSLWGMHAALETILEFRQDQIEAHLLAITRTLMDGLQRIPGIDLITPTESSERAGIVTIVLPEGNDENVVLSKLLARNIMPAVRDGKLRFSPHFYCSSEDMNAVVQAVREAI